MKVLIIGNEARYRQYMPHADYLPAFDIVYQPRDASLTDLLAAGSDADAIAVDPTVQLPEGLINKMPHLKIIQSEGVGYNGIDIDTAHDRGIYVCNQKGANAPAVAEQTILLMLALLRQFVLGDRTVRNGGQLAMKERLMIEGIREMADCRVGYIGFGDIAKATTDRLKPFGCQQFYHTPNRKASAVEKQYAVAYLTQDQLIATCDFVVILCPLNESTRGMVNASFLSKMKPDAFLINTARGEIVDNQALYDAIFSETIAGAGLDTISPIPVPKDHILFKLPSPYADRLIVSPHIGGVTMRFFQDAHQRNWLNIYKALNGEMPDNIVNGL
ncbi:hydroxyacid dehydrogenase [Fusibacter paucivorans]|uniref:Hydroxyacid dehydrogenase n=1 Tax=Fusibacter paucivorans TaxID=76009 RepID=A0ABS5PN24_9FIRM|nr:NAD(P)-dependent oxidoreductase [Fusibacter paucivorans]MBS7526302.1 hydroxyacid dehydrogenase [Fusibacter paucivorans]